MGGSLGSFFSTASTTSATQPRARIIAGNPIVGADNAGFVGQLASVEGLEGAAVTNPGSIGGAGVEVAIRILDGQSPEERTVLVQPEIWDNVTEEGRAKIEAGQNPDLDPEWPVSVSIDGFTTYSMEEIIACEGPGA